VFGCPFNVPRYDARNLEGFGVDKAFKCTKCFERLGMGEQPACTKTCPTGALSFMDKAKLAGIAGAAEERGLEVYNGGSLSTDVVFLLEGKPVEYGLPAKPAIPTPTYLWRTVMKPLGVAAFVVAVFAAIAHFAYIGPKDVEEDGGNPPPAAREGGEY
jgi:formate dehydrogenase iron-sulfur subunit